MFPRKRRNRGYDRRLSNDVLTATKPQSTIMEAIYVGGAPNQVRVYLSIPVFSLPFVVEPTGFTLDGTPAVSVEADDNTGELLVNFPIPVDTDLEMVVPAGTPIVNAQGGTVAGGTVIPHIV